MKSRITFIVSGKGGVGKSSLACHLGTALARKNKTVLLLELDSGLRSLDIMLGVDDRVLFDLGDVLADRCEPSKAITCCEEFSEKLFLLCAPSEDLKQPDILKIKQLIFRLSSFYQEIIIDMPAGTGTQFHELVEMGDTILICVTPDPISVRDGAKIYQSMDVGSNQQMKLVINRVPPSPKMLVMRDLDAVIDMVGAQLIGVIPDEKEISLCSAMGKPLAPNLKSHLYFENIADRMSGRSVPLIIC